jgi:CRP-like cAMP-binding protein
LLTPVVVISDGHGFGELALMSKKRDKRSASAICEGEVHLAILGKEDFQKVVLVSMERKLA